MRRRGKVLIALAIATPLVLLGGGLAASADQLSAGEDTVVDIAVSSTIGENSGAVEAKQIQQRERDCPGSCLQERTRLCIQDCELAEDCEFDCWGGTVIGREAPGENPTRANRACYSRRVATSAEEKQSVDPPSIISGIDCFKCDREPLNEYPPNSPWYTGDE